MRREPRSLGQGAARPMNIEEPIFMIMGIRSSANQQSVTVT